MLKEAKYGIVKRCFAEEFDRTWKEKRRRSGFGSVLGMKWYTDKSENSDRRRIGRAR